MRLVVEPTPEAAAEAAAAEIAGQLRAAIGDSGRASLAVSGGTTPVEMVRRLSQQDVDWVQVDLFQVDERAVPHDDPARNWTLVAPLTELIPESRCHAMPVELDDGDVLYARVLQDAAGSPPAIDVVHLGLGADGHTASLVPGDPGVDVTDRDVVWVGEYRGHRRMSLTVPVLRAARCQVWLVAGADKAAALGDLVAGRSSAPAARVIGTDAIIVADEAALSRG